MERNAYADRFADCVVRRTEYDTVMKPGIILLTMALPALLALAVVTIVIDVNIGVNFTEEGVSAGILVALVTECCVIGYMLYMLSGRTARHQKRDDIWAEALIGYARSNGADTSEMEDLARRMHRRGRGPLRALSLVMWGFSVLFLLLLGVYLGLLSEPLDQRVYLLGMISYVLLLLQFLLSTGATYGFPYKHEKVQVEFTEAFSRRMDDVGLSFPSMKPLVGKPHSIIMGVLFVITFGLFSLVLFLLACRNMNIHIHNQWAYEQEVLDTIIRIEGGKGVRPVEGAKVGAATRIVRSLF